VLPTDRPLLLAQLTDTHVVAPDTEEELWVDNNGRLVDAVASINAESPAVAVVLATGDLTNDGRPVESEELAHLLRPLVAPLLPLPGNHDDRDALRATFPDVPWADARHASWTTTIGDGDDAVRLVGLDSTRPGCPGGEFDVEREEWLRSELGVPFDGVTILAMHHPPFETGIDWMDRSGFAGLDRFESVLAECPLERRVDRIVCGHLHRPITSAVAGVPVSVGPSTVQSVVLDLSASSSPTVIREPVGYLLHLVTGRRIVTHTRYIATAEPAIVPTWAQDRR
jgi:Icc protein